MARLLSVLIISGASLFSQAEKKDGDSNRPETKAVETDEQGSTAGAETAKKKPAKKPQQKQKSASLRPKNRATIMARTTYWILLKDDTYLKGQLVVLPSNNYLIINSQYLDGRLLKRNEVARIGDTDFRAIEGLPKKKR